MHPLAVAGQVAGPIPAQDRAALQTIVPIRIDAAGWDKLLDVVDDLKAITGPGGGGLAIHLTGPAGNAADQATAFQGIDGTLLYTTLIVVALILLVTYRSLDPKDVDKNQLGYEIIADCIEFPGEASLAAAREFYDTERHSPLRRFVRRICFENK